MSDPTHDGVFAEVINNLMKELHTLPHGTDTIYRFLVSNLNSPILAEIHHLSLCNLDTNQMTAVLPALAQMISLISLALPHCKPSPHQLQFLFTECPALTKLQSLDLSQASQLGSKELTALSQSTTLTNLTSLSLAGYSKAPFDPELYGLKALLLSPVVQNLTHLNLSRAVISDPLIHITIATSPHLSNLVSLDLADNDLSRDAVEALARTSTLSNLTHLNLANNSLDDELITQLFSPLSLLPHKLQFLDLSVAFVSMSSLEMLPKACPHLTELVLVSNYQLGPAMATFLATSMPNLTKLDLSDCGIEDEGYIALAESTTLVSLRELSLRENWAQAESIIALVNSPVMANLTHLNLAETHSGPQVITVIAQSPSMSKLQHLKLYSNEVGDEGVIALAQSTTLTNLISLKLCANDIGPAGVLALCTSPVVSNLTDLSLARNPSIGNSLAAALSAPSSTLYNLRDLEIWEIKMDDSGVLQLLATPFLDQLDSLEIGYNAIDSSTEAVYRARFDGFI